MSSILALCWEEIGLLIMGNLLTVKWKRSDPDLDEEQIVRSTGESFMWLERVK